MAPKHLQFCMSSMPSEHIATFCSDWYADADACPVSLSRDLSMNNISEIQSRAFHRLHLLSELWVKSSHSHSIDKHPSAQHDKKQLFPEPLISSVMGIDDSGLLLISPAKKRPAAIASRSCTKGVGGIGRGLLNLIVTERANIWSLKCLESRFSALHPSRCSIWLGFSWTARRGQYTHRDKASAKTDALYCRSGLRWLKRGGFSCFEH